MKIVTVCPECGARYKNIPESYLGKRVKCKRCKKSFEIKAAVPEKTGYIEVLCPECGKKHRKKSSQIDKSNMLCGKCNEKSRIKKAEATTADEFSFKQTPRIVYPELKHSKITYSPQSCPRVTGWSGGININRKDRAALSYQNIVLISILSSAENSKNECKMLFFVEDCKRPFIVDAHTIQYKDFPGVKNGISIASLRNFLLFLCNHNPEIMLDENTVNFGNGSQLKRMEKDVNSLATALGKILESGNLSTQEPAPAAGKPLPHISPYAMEATEIDMPPREISNSGTAKGGTSPDKAKVCPKCGAKDQHGKECSECGVLFERYSPYQVLHKCAESISRAGSKFGTLNSINYKENLDAYSLKWHDAAVLLEDGKDINGNPVSIEDVAANLIYGCMHIEWLFMLGYGHVPTRVWNILSEIKDIVRFSIVPDPYDLDNLELMTSVVVWQRDRLTAILKQPERPLPILNNGIDLNTVFELLINMCGINATELQQLVEGSAEIKPEKIKESGKSFQSLMSTYKNANYLAIFAQCFPSNTTNLIDAVCRLVAVGFILAGYTYPDKDGTPIVKDSNSPPLNAEPGGTGANQSKSQKEDCFIATAVYGDSDSIEVRFLREFRDKKLKRSNIGTLFIKFYYRVSPPIAEFLKKKRGISRLVRLILDKTIIALERCRWE